MAKKSKKKQGWLEYLWVAVIAIGAMIVWTVTGKYLQTSADEQAESSGKAAGAGAAQGFGAAVGEFLSPGEDGVGFYGNLKNLFAKKA